NEGIGGPQEVRPGSGLLRQVDAQDASVDRQQAAAVIVQEAKVANLVRIDRHAGDEAALTMAASHDTLLDQRLERALDRAEAERKGLDDVDLRRQPLPGLPGSGLDGLQQ